MKIISVQEAQTRLAQLIEQTANGENFTITQAGKPIATLSAYQKSPTVPQRIGFMRQLNLPEDFDRMGEQTITELFTTDK